MQNIACQGHLPLNTVDLHKRRPLLQTGGGPPFFPAKYLKASPVLPSWQIVSTTPAGGPPSAKMGWASKSNIFEDLEAQKLLEFLLANCLGDL